MKLAKDKYWEPQSKVGIFPMAFRPIGRQEARVELRIGSIADRVPIPTLIFAHGDHAEPAQFPFNPLPKVMVS